MSPSAKCYPPLPAHEQIVRRKPLPAWWWDDDPKWIEPVRKSRGNGGDSGEWAMGIDADYDPLFTPSKSPSTILMEAFSAQEEMSYRQIVALTGLAEKTVRVTLAFLVSIGAIEQRHKRRRRGGSVWAKAGDLVSERLKISQRDKILAALSGGSVASVRHLAAVMGGANCGSVRNAVNRLVKEGLVRQVGSISSTGHPSKLYALRGTK